MVVVEQQERAEQVCSDCGYRAMLGRTQKPPCPICQSVSWRSGRPRRRHDD
jgi:rubrerythrin